MRRLALVKLVVVALAVGACGDDGGPTGTVGQPTTLVAVSGDGQRVAVRGTIVEPFVVKVTDDRGNPIGGVEVSWAVTAGGGSLSASVVKTDIQGEASVFLTAGDAEGDQTVTASVPDLEGSPVTFSATALAPSAMTLVSGDGQMGRVGQPLRDSLVVRVTATDGGPLPGATVDWVATAGSGRFSNPRTATGADGRAATVLSLGTFPVTNVVTATVEGTSLSVTFTAAATPAVSVTVNMQNIAFIAPGGTDDVTILLGDTVRWVNLDDVQHTVTSDRVPEGGRSFDSGLLNKNETFIFVPKVRGLWIYHCEVHPTSMRDARITVE
jgi:plastocyanin